MDNLSIALWMNLSDGASEGPGWYIWAGSTGNAETKSLIEAKRVSAGTAEELAISFENALQGQLEAGAITPSQLAGSGSNLIRQAIRNQLDEAEAQARKVKSLRRLLEAESSVTVSTDTDQE